MFLHGMNIKPQIMGKGHLTEDIVRTRERALRIGALLSIPTEFEYLKDGDIVFLVRILSRLAQKDKERRQQEESWQRKDKPVNPFLPYDKDLYVADISESHVALLNKFNVMDDHLLIITRHFEDQETLLTVADFEALCLCLAEFDGLGFYNGGITAGASQSHKHLQVVPLPLAPRGPAVPIRPLIPDHLENEKITRLSRFPFLNSFCALPPAAMESPRDAALICFTLYSQLLRALHLASPSIGRSSFQSGPYCLLVTRNWMLLVPRSREHFESISINSLGFAGSFFLRSYAEFDRLRTVGPMKILQYVSLPVPAS